MVRAEVVASSQRDGHWLCELHMQLAGLASVSRMVAGHIGMHWFLVFCVSGCVYMCVIRYSPPKDNLL